MELVGLLMLLALASLIAGLAIWAENGRGLRAEFRAALKRRGLPKKTTLVELLHADFKQGELHARVNGIGAPDVIRIEDRDGDAVIVCRWCGDIAYHKNRQTAEDQLVGHRRWHMENVSNFDGQRLSGRFS